MAKRKNTPKAKGGNGHKPASERKREREERAARRKGEPSPPRQPLPKPAPRPGVTTASKLPGGSE